jgi:chemotaxis protein CheC
MTHPVCQTNASELLLLQQLFASATHDASAAMCCWTNSVITLTLDEVCEIPLADACLELNLDDERITMVVLNLEGEIGGTMVLTFNEENGRRLAASLLQGEAGQGPGWSEMEVSALNETGNILGCAYVNAITRLINQQLVPSVPYFVEDFGASVLQQALVTQALGRDTVLICRTSFHCENEDLMWRVLFIPTVALRAAMEEAIHLEMKSS